MTEGLCAVSGHLQCPSSCAPLARAALQSGLGIASGCGASRSDPLTPLQIPQTTSYPFTNPLLFILAEVASLVGN